MTKTGTANLILGGSAANTVTSTLAINEGAVLLNKTAGTNAWGGSGITVGDGSGSDGLTWQGGASGHRYRRAHHQQLRHGNAQQRWRRCR